MSQIFLCSNAQYSRYLCVSIFSYFSGFLFPYWSSGNFTGRLENFPKSSETSLDVWGTSQSFPWGSRNWDISQKFEEMSRKVEKLARKFGELARHFGELARQFGELFPGSCENSFRKFGEHFPESSGKYPRKLGKPGTVRYFSKSSGNTGNNPGNPRNLS